MVDSMLELVMMAFICFPFQYFYINHIELLRIRSIKSSQLTVCTYYVNDDTCNAYYERECLLHNAQVIWLAFVEFMNYLEYSGR